MYRWVSARKKGFESALKMGSRGQTSAAQKRLSDAQEALLMKLICDKNPLQMKFPFALWNRKTIKQVIWNLWSIRLALRTISDYMKRWEFTPQKPAKMAYERNSKAVQNG